MSKIFSEGIVDLIGALTKAEKRSFRLYAKRNSSQTDLKFLLLFDYILKMGNLDEKYFLEKHPTIKSQQLANLKAHLYKQILRSLRSLTVPDFMEIEIREKIDFALILHNKGFTELALKQLEKANELAQKSGHNVLLLETIELAKHVETQYFTRSLVGRVQLLTKRSSQVLEQVSNSVAFSNLFLEVFGLYLKIGFVRDEEEYQAVANQMKARMKTYKVNDLGFEEKNNLYNAMVWYHFIVQDFVLSYKYAKQWLELFDDFPVYKQTRKENYLKAQNNYLNAVFNLRSYQRFDVALQRFIEERYMHQDNESISLIYDFYYYSNVINRYYFEGTFSEGVKLVPEIISFIDNNVNRDRIDDHRIMNLYYKIACLYFGAGDNRKTIFYLNKVIQFSSHTLRDDIQSFARILNLIAHFELGNDVLLETQIKSVYRYLIKKEELRGVQKEIFVFLKNMPYTTSGELRKAFIALQEKLLVLTKDRFEKRAFLYLDIISWLECKLTGKTVQEVVRAKFLEEQKTGDKLYFPR